MNEVADIASEWKQRLEVSARKFDQSAYDKERAMRLANERQGKVESLRSGWNAPTRQVLNRPNLKQSGAWLETRNKVVEKIGKGFLIALIGLRGNGKTQIGVETMFAVTEQFRAARYLSSMEFFMEIKATYKDKSAENEKSILKRFEKFSLLVVDEIGKRSENEWENRLLFELLDRRYREMKDTLVISNQSGPEFEAAVGASITSRLNESGGIIECNWESFRN